MTGKTKASGKRRAKVDSTLTQLSRLRTEHLEAHHALDDIGAPLLNRKREPLNLPGRVKELQKRIRTEVLLSLSARFLSDALDDRMRAQQERAAQAEPDPIPTWENEGGRPAKED